VIDLSLPASPLTIDQNRPLSGVNDISHTFTYQLRLTPPWKPSLISIPDRQSDDKSHAINCTTIAKGNHFAIDCIGDSAFVRSSDLDRLIASSLSERTRRAYRSDLSAFEAWLGRSIPASAEEIAEYLAAMSPILKPATLSRRLASISKAHRAAGLPSPVSAEIVRSAFRGIRREQGVAQRIR
jgi:hypothetical protein